METNALLQQMDFGVCRRNINTNNKLATVTHIEKVKPSKNVLCLSYNLLRGVFQVNNSQASVYKSSISITERYASKVGIT